MTLKERLERIMSRTLHIRQMVADEEIIKLSTEIAKLSIEIAKEAHESLHELAAPRHVMPWYQEMARCINAKANCEKSNNTEWADKHQQAIERLIDMLPHGGGLDGKWALLADNDEKIILSMSYHAMDDAGYYGRWIDFNVIIRPSLLFGCELYITGNFGKHQDIKDYLYDTLDYAVKMEADLDKLYK